MSYPAVETAKRRRYINRLTTMAAAGAIGGFIGFVLGEWADFAEAAHPAESRHLTGVWFMFVIVGIGAGLIAGQSFVQRMRPSTRTMVTGVVALLVGGYIGGYTAQSVYAEMLDWVRVERCSESVDIGACLANVLSIPRALGWMIAGALGGAGVGAAFWSWRRVQNGAIGGALGGLVGGLLFDRIALALNSSDAAVSRFVAIVLIGALMGLLIGLIETARTSIWLEVISGELRGREFAVVDARTSVGSARTAGIPLLGDRSIKEVHLIIETGTGQPRFNCTTAESIVVNGVETSAGHLSHGDVIRIGSTDVRVSLRSAAPTATVFTPKPLSAQTLPPPAAGTNSPGTNSSTGSRRRPTAREALGDVTSASTDGVTTAINRPVEPASPVTSPVATEPGTPRQRPRIPMKPQ